MEKYKQITITLAILTFILSAGASTSNASSSKRNNDDEKEKQAYELLLTFEEGDYEEWKKIIGVNSNLAKLISKDHFYKFLESRELARSGQYDLAIKKSNALIREIEQIIKSCEDCEVSNFNPEKIRQIRGQIPNLRNELLAELK